MDFVDRQTFQMEPDTDDTPRRPRWMTSYPKEGREEDGETLKLEMPAAQWPPGTRVVILVPVCPQCGDPADMNGADGKHRRRWPACKCGFSWNKFADRGCRNPPPATLSQQKVSSPNRPQDTQNQ